MNDMIYRQDAINALWKALYKYEDETEKQFIESEDLDVGDWILHRSFVQNMSDIDRQTILNLPPAQPETCAYWDSESNLCALHRPSAQPFSEEEIQKIQDLEQAELEKAFELGRRKEEND